MTLYLLIIIPLLTALVLLASNGRRAITETIAVTGGAVELLLALIIAFRFGGALGIGEIGRAHV